MSYEQCRGAFESSPLAALLAASGATEREPPPSRDDIRFWSKVSRVDGDGCWEWTGSFFSHGYGAFYFQGRQRPAHRHSWEMVYGEIPFRRAHVCHRCDNPRCVRIGHLFLGMAADNVADKVSKGRQSSKLSDADVASIRSLCAGGHESQRSIARRFGVSHTHVQDIVAGRQRVVVK